MTNLMMDVAEARNTPEKHHSVTVVYSMSKFLDSNTAVMAAGQVLTHRG